MISMELSSISEKSTEQGGVTKVLLNIPKPVDKFTSDNMISFYSQFLPFIQNSNFIFINSNLILKFLFKILILFFLLIQS